MKNQHFGGINDYRKYGLSRALQSSGDGRLLVAWMLTPDDSSRDGGPLLSDRWNGQIEAIGLANKPLESTSFAGG